jgi:hypothetical protein
LGIGRENHKQSFPSLSKMVDKPVPKKSLEELREERRRARWSAFWTPFITLASIVSSVGLLMFFVRACQDRLPFPLQQAPPAPLKNQSVVRLTSTRATVGHQIEDPSVKLNSGRTTKDREGNSRP